MSSAERTSNYQKSSRISYDVVLGIVMILEKILDLDDALIKKDYVICSIQNLVEIISIMPPNPSKSGLQMITKICELISNYIQKIKGLQEYIVQHSSLTGRLPDYLNLKMYGMYFVYVILKRNLTVSYISQYAVPQ